MYWFLLMCDCHVVLNTYINKLCGRPPQYAPAPCKLTFDLLTLKVVYESHVMWATSVPILIFLGLSVLDVGPTYATDVRQTSNRCQTSDRRPGMGSRQFCRGRGRGRGRGEARQRQRQRARGRGEAD